MIIAASHEAKITLNLY